MTTKDEALRVAREALDNVQRNLPMDVWFSVRQDMQAVRDALSTIALAVEAPNNCQHGIPHRWPCEQCDSPAVQSVALGEPKAIQHPSTRPRSVDDPAGLPGTSNGQENGNG